MGDKWICRVANVVGNTIILDASNSLTLNVSKEYIVRFAAYSFINTATNQLNRGTWYADNDALTIAGTVRARRWK